MRKSDISDVQELVSLYTDAAIYANEVGHIEWPIPFPEDELTSYMLKDELFCFDEPPYAAAVKLSRDPNHNIWRYTENTNNYLYLGKMATSAKVRHSGYTEHTLLPSVLEYAKKRTLKESGWSVLLIILA